MFCSELYAIAVFINTKTMDMITVLIRNLDTNISSWLKPFSSEKHFGTVRMPKKNAEMVCSPATFFSQIKKKQARNLNANAKFKLKNNNIYSIYISCDNAHDKSIAWRSIFDF